MVTWNAADMHKARKGSKIGPGEAAGVTVYELFCRAIDEGLFDADVAGMKALIIRTDDCVAKGVITHEEQELIWRRWQDRQAKNPKMAPSGDVRRV